MEVNFAHMNLMLDKIYKDESNEEKINLQSDGQKEIVNNVILG